MTNAGTDGSTGVGVWSDLSAASGAYNGGFYINPPPGLPFSAGRAMTVQVDSSDAVTAIRTVCR